jgi:nitrate reductase gamma subunit
MMTVRTWIVIILLLVGAWLAGALVVLAQDPIPSEDNCWACHRQPNWTGIEGTRATITLCLDCHADLDVDTWAEEARTPVYMDPEAHRQTLHGEIACVACHVDVVRNPHQAVDGAACAGCHATLLSHVNMGAPHLSTDCAACHREDLPVSHDAKTGRVVLAEVDARGAPIDRTDHRVVREASCDKCHVTGNDVGAPAITLPARSVLCMACHDASPTVSVGFLDPTPVVTDWGSIVGLLVLGVGVVLNASLYLRGQIPGHPTLTTMEKLNYIAADVTQFCFSRRCVRFLGGLIADGLLLRRALQEGVGKWVMHALIYWPFLARFGLGLVTWLGELFWPQAAWTQALADKNTPGVAFFNDLCALLVLLGVAWAMARRFLLHERRLLTFAQDRLAISLLGAIFLVGILAEGLRLLSAGTPQEVAVYSFLGYAVAALLRPVGAAWTSIYPLVWYLHGLLAVALVAYLPFSKFLHLLAGPFIASLDTARKGTD